VAFHFGDGPLASEAAAAALDVRFDGQAAVRTDDLAAVTRGCERPTVAIVSSASGTDVLVCVPHFSPHTVEVGLASLGAALQMLPALAPQLGLLVAVAAAGLVAGLWVHRHGRHPHRR